MILTFVKHIDDGGFGSVDHVQDENGCDLARKTFARNQPLSDELLANVLKRFRKEVRIQKSLSNRNIVPILGDALDASPPYFVMPLAINSLSKDIEADKTLGGDFVAAISDIVAGLEELHSMQIYHRDLKPRNVLRLGDDQGEFYAIGDFGLISMKESTISTLTKTGMAMGSDYYTAPEITKDLKLASVQSDIFSLGCILHDMVGTEDRVPCSEIREQGDYSGILLGCTRREPLQRFKSVRAVLDAIISVGIVGVMPTAQKSIDFIEALTNGTTIEAEGWRSLAAYLEDEAAATDKQGLFGALSADRIAETCNSAPEAANRIALGFAEWVYSTSFSFEYCDGLANRLETFVMHCDFEAKCACLLAMLELGTSHNRWYVERKFFRLCSPAIDGNLAKRLAIEFRVVGIEICRSIDKLEHSISVSREGMHPELVRALAEICV